MKPVASTSLPVASAGERPWSCGCGGGNSRVTMLEQCQRALGLMRDAEGEDGDPEEEDE